MSNTMEQILAIAAGSQRDVRRSTPHARAQWLRSIAQALEADSVELVAVADRETNLGAARLEGELRRTEFQARYFAGLLEDDTIVPDLIEAADPDWPVAPRPHLVRSYVPLGVALVFGASNFPFAFGVVGTDTVTALAAGCPVIVKSHPSHPETAALLERSVRRALNRVGAPAGAFSRLEGVPESLRALADPRVRVGAFTGSRTGGVELFRVAVSRDDPIPFFAEMSSNNPVVISPDAWRSRAAEIVAGFVRSTTNSAGQLCTSPNVLFVPSAAEFLGRIDLPPAPALLHDGIIASYRAAVARWRALPGASTRDFGALSGAGASAQLVAVSAAAVRDDPTVLESELFGPGAVLVEYDTLSDIAELIDLLPGQLTGTVHGDPSDRIIDDIADRLAEKVGRLIWNDWPTGVAVSAAQTHGGPFPATTISSATSVGANAILRFLRPITVQNRPDANERLHG